MVEHANNNDRHRLVWSQGHKNLGRSKTVTGNWGKLRKLLTDVFVDKAYTVTTYQAITNTEEKTARKNLQGFFLGGPTKEGSRSNNGIAYRTIITLDIDDMTAEQFEDWMSRKAGRLWQWEFVAAETRSSTDHAPRFRLVFPLTGKLDHEQYNAASRILGSLLFDDEDESMRAVDDVSFRFAQLMFLPTASKGQDLQVKANGKVLGGFKTSRAAYYALSAHLEDKFIDFEGHPSARERTTPEVYVVGPDDAEIAIQKHIRERL